MKEEDLACKVIEWISGHQWTVYQEVDLRHGIADIVAVCGRRVWIIEVKTSFSFAVMAQAYRWRKFAHWCSIAIPSPKQRHSERGFRNQICRDYGIGIILVDRYGASEDVKASINRRIRPDLVLDRLNDHQKTYARAGNSDGRRWTPFQQTCSEIREHLRCHPGCNLKSLIDNVKTHYGTPSTARACISKYIESGIIKGIRTERDGKHLRLYLEGKNGA